MFADGEASRNDASAFRSRFLVPGGKTPEYLLELAWQDGRQEIDRDTEIAIDIFCEYLGDAFETVKDRVAAVPSVSA